MSKDFGDQIIVEIEANFPPKCKNMHLAASLCLVSGLWLNLLDIQVVKSTALFSSQRLSIKYKEGQKGHEVSVCH